MIGVHAPISVSEDRNDGCPGQRVESKVKSGHGRGNVRVDAQLVGVQRMHGEHVPVRLVARRGSRAAEVLGPVVVADAERSLGQAGSVAESSVTDAVMSMTSQCQKPEPVGASGSKQVTANPSVSAGNPCQLRWGEMFCPDMPKPLYT